MQKRPACRKRPPLDYQDETHGSRLAAKARRMANGLTPAERRDYFNQAVAIIPAGDRPKEATAFQLRRQFRRKFRLRLDFLPSVATDDPDHNSNCNPTQ